MKDIYLHLISDINQVKIWAARFVQERELTAELSLLAVLPSNQVMELLLVEHM